MKAVWSFSKEIKNTYTINPWLSGCCTERTENKMFSISMPQINIFNIIAQRVKKAEAMNIINRYLGYDLHTFSLKRPDTPYHHQWTSDTCRNIADTKNNAVIPSRGITAARQKARYHRVKTRLKRSNLPTRKWNGLWGAGNDVTMHCEVQFCKIRRFRSVVWQMNILHAGVHKMVWW